MKLYLVHCGFYDREVAYGVYEFHTNFTVVADSAQDAKKRAKSLDAFRAKSMHVDGVQEIQVVDGYRVHLTVDPSWAGRTHIVNFKGSDLATAKAPDA